jgi:hypothetical protein
VEEQEEGGFLPPKTCLPTDPPPAEGNFCF